MVYYSTEKLQSADRNPYELKATIVVLSRRFEEGKKDNYQLFAHFI
ncbi:hypothetical protein XBFFL1_2560054 [Xenorhabdus bovienii str. feltiae Florida]|uniref:Uncharacterized protein n=1 Tax=Xenorhabdus bovienii str. feltiae Moldova TaxID=1398200 RepID=A0A077NSD5_XENBV|nr:hypothetical protein XBFFR1_900055 [Xenorhabdus bovienii str. feltiae France]CDG93598.1 hypothetical protein XBFFL1_2560054 [Xenorhabdus bovienii str. feltiae Florida]CDH01509.1 hypothetical protein XBFM1_220001 [Xenorhabdus bovienii str. feltiae Moldova]